MLESKCTVYVGRLQSLDSVWIVLHMALRAVV